MTKIGDIAERRRTKLTTHPRLYEPSGSPFFCSPSSASQRPLRSSLRPIRHWRMSLPFDTSFEELILPEVDTVLGDLLTLARQLIDMSDSLPAEMSIDRDAVGFEVAGPPINPIAAPMNGTERVPTSPYTCTEADKYTDAHEALDSFFRIKRVYSKFGREGVKNSDRTQSQKTRRSFPATRPNVDGASVHPSPKVEVQRSFIPGPPIYADATIPFAYSRTHTQPISPYDSCSRAIPVSAPVPNFNFSSGYEQWRSPAQNPPNNAYMHSKPGPIAQPNFTTGFNAVQRIVKPQTKSPRGRRVYNAPLAPRFTAAAAPSFPTNFGINPHDVNAAERIPPAVPRFDLGALAVKPPVREPEAQTSRVIKANQERPVFTNPWDNNKIIEEDTWSDPAPAAGVQDDAPVETSNSQDQRPSNHLSYQDRRTRLQRPVRAHLRP
ncbi:uncharacterized protein BT62DRAFT_622293 [Guyanagaster necrorhizus]|uniref:Uncharacterized protein n=1 Tax=Guyanagaster necrorhizus TaxID=856835 RepID=A0A9P7W000_9AGAR|nr:uncharacterized protein BT62DRAFT_622293 [Guyanagaster necrorhizus MCA 3950]KAG7450069.1 hypothetical protein BT62DRAFT_622293 [Guyanagaster necrorhizus MCA 3950]